MVFFKNNFKKLFLPLFVILVCFQAGVTLRAAFAEDMVPQDVAVSAPALMPVEQSATAPASLQGEEVQPGQTQSYRVGPDDEIKVTVFGEEELSGKYAVNGNGFVSLPLIGDVKVEGLSLKEIEAAIVASLKDGYLLDPRVSIEVSKYRPFYILGEVRVPGSYAYVNNMSVLNAVAMAGGFTYRANKKYVEIMRTHDQNSQVNKEQPVEADILPGDIILVKERFF